MKRDWFASVAFIWLYGWIITSVIVITAVWVSLYGAVVLLIMGPMP